MKEALAPAMLDGWNQGFLRKEARLAVVTLTDEEETTSARGDICYYAAKGVDPWGNTGTTNASGAFLPYQLTPVEEYARFLTVRKGSAQAVSFSAIVRVPEPLCAPPEPGQARGDRSLREPPAGAHRHGL